MKKVKWGIAVILILSVITCIKTNEEKKDSTPKSTRSGSLDYWLTKGDRSILFEKQKSVDFFINSTVNQYPVIEVDTATRFQEIYGFGYTLTGGSAALLHKMSSFQKNALLNELFGCESSGLCISYLRVSLGASDLDETVFSYNDIDINKEDIELSSFSLSKDTMALIPVLKEILKINPKIKIMASPWSAPLWMKSNKSSVGGSLLPKYYDVYARYFVKYIQEMRKNGIEVDAVTIQNEPEHGGNNPSMLMKASEQNDFIKKHLGPAFKLAGLKTKIVIWDHNCDNPQYPISILNDKETKPFVDGSAFHLYAGSISAMTTVYNAHPDKSLYFTEQWTGANGSFNGDLVWHVKNVIVGSLRNWSRVVLEWNLANDPAYRPHTPGGCSQCKGALTVSGNIYSKNVSYYIIAHASAFLGSGAVRVGSNDVNNISSVALHHPSGKKVLIAVNDSKQEEIFNIAFYGKNALTSIPAESVATYVWQ